jgi:hypothetical protein
MNRDNHDEIEIPGQFWDDPDEPPIWPEVALALGVVALAFSIIIVTAWGWL